MFKALGRVFSKVGKKLAGAVSDPKALAVAKLVSIHVPVVGAPFAIALAAVGKAEKIFGPKTGDKKRPWAVSETSNELRKLGLEEKRILGLVELALLVFKGEASVTEFAVAAENSKLEEKKPEEEKPEEEHPKGSRKPRKQKEKHEGKSDE